MNDNYNYVLNNLGVNLTNNEWLRHIEKYFGEKDTKKFCEYLINARNICRKIDIRNIIYSGSMSVFSMVDDEQLAIFNIFRPIDIESNIVKNIGLEKVKIKCNKRDIELDKEIKKYGYSYSKIKFNFKVENIKDTFQSKYINVVCSEKNTENEFFKNTISIAKAFRQPYILITDKIPKIKTPQMIIKGKIYNTETREVIKEVNDITIKEIEKYLMLTSNSKVSYEVPYYKNKNIIDINETKAIFDLDYYGKYKQAKVKEFNPYSMNTGMLKMALLNKFSSKDYNN